MLEATTTKKYFTTLLVQVLMPLNRPIQYRVVSFTTFLLMENIQEKSLLSSRQNAFLHVSNLKTGEKLENKSAGIESF